MGKTFTTGRKPNNQKRITESMPFLEAENLGLEGLFDGDIVHLSFDCPKNLRTAFNTETRHNGTSVCKELQKYMASYVLKSSIKKHAYGNTFSKILDGKISIGELNFTQQVQSRVRRKVKNVVEMEEETETVDTVDHAAISKDKQFCMVLEQWDYSRVNQVQWRNYWRCEAEKWRERCPTAELILRSASKNG